MKSLIKLFITGLLVSNSVFADDNSNNTAQISALLAKYQTALNASDTQKVMALYGPQPVFMPQHAPAQLGRASIEQAYKQVFETIDLDVEFTTHQMEVSGNTAWARTSSAGMTRILANDLVVTEGNNELFIFKKEHGQWKIHQYLFSTNQPRQ